MGWAIPTHLIAALAAIALLEGTAHGQQAPPVSIALIPHPKNITVLPGMCPLDGPSVTVEAEDPTAEWTQEDTTFLAEDLRARLQHLDGDRLLHITVDIAEQIEGVPENTGQAYRLQTAPDRIRITGTDAAGVFHGTQTLLQILDQRPAPLGEIPALLITDWPDIQYRASQHDTRSQIMRNEELKRIIRKLAYFKYNQFYLYVENTFQYNKHPDIPPPYSFSPQDVADLVAFGRRCHVDVLPIQQSLGHQYELLRVPAYTHLAESQEHIPGTHHLWTLSPAFDETYDLLADMYADWLTVCPAPFLYVGCDEAYTLGLGATKELADEIGVGGVLLEHLKRIQTLVPQGHRIGVAGDMLLKHKEDVEGKIPKDIVVYDWHYSPQDDGYPSVEWFRKQGLDVFICPATIRVLWEFSDTDSATKTIERFTLAGKKHGAIGFLNCNFEFPYQGFFDNGWYGFAYGADTAWSDDASLRQPEVFDERFARVFFRSDAPGLGEVFRLLGEPNGILRREWPDAEWFNIKQCFWEEPRAQDYLCEMNRLSLEVKGFHMFTRDSTAQTANRILAAADRAERLLRNEGQTARANDDLLEVLDYAARRWQYYAHRLLYTQSARDAYEQALTMLDRPPPGSCGLAGRTGTPEPIGR